MVVLSQNELKSNFVKETDIPNQELNQRLPLEGLDATTNQYTNTYNGIYDGEEKFKVSKESEIDILVVGAGPVGLLMCIQLARLDDRPEVNHYQRAVLFHVRTIEIFKQIGLYDLIQKNPYYEKADVLGYASYLNGEPKYNVKLPNPKNSTIDHQIGIYQSELEKCMVQHLKTQFNFYVQRNTKFIKLEYFQNSTKVKSALFKNMETNEIERVYCKYLVGSDGGRSEIRKQAGFKFEGYSYDSSILLLDVVLNEESSILPKELKVVNAFWSEKCSLVWVIPKTSNRFIVYYPNLAEANALTSDGCIDLVNQVIKPFKIDVKSVLRYAASNCNERIAHQHYSNNLFLAGDAAHVHTPAGGMGVNLGMQDAYNLAFKLVLINNSTDYVIKDQVALSYHLERRSEAKRVLNYSGKVLRTNMTPNTYLDILGSRVKASNLGFGSDKDKQNLSENVSMTEYIYPKNPMLLVDEDKGDGNNVKAVVGKRFPHVILYLNDKTQPRAILDILSGLQFEIFIFLPISLFRTHRCIVKKWTDELDTFVNRLNDISVPAKWAQITYNSNSRFDDGSDVTDGLKDFNLSLYSCFGFDNYENAYNSFGSDNPDKVQLFIIRPDAHLALSKSIDLDFNSEIKIETYLAKYFGNFVQL